MVILFFLAEIARLMSLASPGYPPNAVNGTTVVAELHYGPGIATKAEILSGEGVFAESALDALRQWRFAAKEKGTTTVVVHFRDPNFFSTGSAKRTMDPPKGVGAGAIPRTIVDPPYPANSVAEGSVVLRAEVSPGGMVTRVETIQEIGGLTEASVGSVRQWRFQPPLDSAGRPAASTVYVVIVFRLPVNAPGRRPGE
jgi:hypothetical protein